MEKFKELARFYLKYLSEVKPEYKQLFEFTLAQWALESGYGKSKLAQEFNNFGGMKFRKELSKQFPKSERYEDWSGETVPYFLLDSFEQYPELYFAFIGRWPYKGFEKHISSGRKFIKFLGKCGYCGAMDGVAKKDVPEAYAKRIELIINSPKFREILNYAYDLQS